MIITYESLGPAPVPTLNGVRLDDPIAITDLIESANARAFEAERNTRQMFDTLTAAQDLASKTLERARAAEAKLTSKKIDDALADANPSKYLALLQADHKEWSTRNFPNAEPLDSILGVVEETGELASAMVDFAEDWLPIPEYEGWYEASDTGKIRRVAGGKGAHPGEERALSVRDDGYVNVCISRGSNADAKVWMVHRLIARTWLGPCPDGFEVNHKDGDKTNNAAWNLEYVTPADNQLHALTIGLRKAPTGEGHHQSKLTEEKVARIRAMYATGEHSYNSLAREFDVSKKTILLIIQGRIWRGNHRLSYDDLRPLLKAQDSVGRLAHALLKQKQGIRGTKEEHEAKAKDAVGDIVIFLLDVCNRRGWSFAEIVAETWAEVRKRDWTKK